MTARTTQDYSVPLSFVGALSTLLKKKTKRLCCHDGIADKTPRGKCIFDCETDQSQVKIST